LTDRVGTNVFALPADVRLAAGEFAVVWCDGDTNTGSWHAPFALDRDGDNVFLYDAQGRRVDALSFGAQVEGYSLGRDAGGDWRLNQPSPAADNVVAATAPASSLALNEWLANALAGDDDWIELFNANAAAPVALRGLYLATDDSLFRIGTHAFLPAGGFLRLWADGQSGGNHVALKLAAAGDSLTLHDTTGAPVDRVSFGVVAEDVSMGRLPDGGSEIVPLAAHTPGWPNSQNPAGSDHDGDGLPDNWELAQGLDPRARSGANGANGDPDGDGQTNAQEFTAGTLPKDPASRLELVAVQSTSGVVELRWDGVPGRNYLVEATTDLVPGSWLALTNVAPPEPGGVVRVPLDFTSPEGFRFFRLIARVR
jgi:hypothetical protein